jgi:hypothetical protein
VPYASRYAIDEDLPRYKLPVNGVDAKVAYQLLHDELALDGNPNMNLASFVHTWVPDECQKLMEENLNKVRIPPGIWVDWAREAAEKEGRGRDKGRGGEGEKGGGGVQRGGGSPLR